MSEEKIFLNLERDLERVFWYSYQPSPKLDETSEKIQEKLLRDFQFILFFINVTNDV